MRLKVVYSRLKSLVSQNGEQLKILQETQEKKWQFQSYAELAGLEKRPEKAREIILLLHGLGERGKRIFRKLLPYLPTDAHILAPNAPFPLPNLKENRVSYGHSWYFYDKFEQKYFINQDLAKFWLRDLLFLENPQKLPVTIIGFSQGGYLAPLVGQIIPQTKLVIGLSCEFRTSLIHEKLSFHLEAVHGLKDTIVSSESAEREIQLLRPLGMNIGWTPLTNTGHEITPEMGQAVRNILEQHGK